MTRVRYGDQITNSVLQARKDTGVGLFSSSDPLQTTLTRVGTASREFPQGVTTMLSGPIGLEQHGAAGFVSSINSVSMMSPDCGLFTFAKLPKVLGSVPDTVNTVPPFLRPLKTYGIGVVLEYRSTELKWNVDPPAVILISAVVVSPARLKNCMEGPGFP